MKLIISILTIFMCISAEAQTLSDTTMMKMRKSQLTNIYIEEVTQLLEKIPFTTFGMTGAKDLDLPDTKYVTSKLSTIQRQNESYSEVVTENINDLISYADKTEIVSAILYLREINARLQLKVKREAGK